MSVDPIDNIPPVANEIVEPEVEPVPEVTPARGARNIVPDGDDTESTLTSADLADMVDISAGARELSLEFRDAKPPAEATDAAVARMASGTGVRELLATLVRYDNGAAVRAYEGYLALFSHYGSPTELIQEELAILRDEPVDKFAFRNLGVFTGGEADVEQRRAVAVAMDRWFEGQGVFKPEMLHFPSGLGFRLSPRSEAAHNARNASAVLATDNPAMIAAYLREMAHLTPGDFIIYDPTGLSALSLFQRRNFLANADAILTRAGIGVRAAELAYAFDADGAVVLTRREPGNAQDARTAKTRRNTANIRRTTHGAQQAQQAQQAQTAQTAQATRTLQTVQTTPATQTTQTTRTTRTTEVAEATQATQVTQNAEDAQSVQDAQSIDDDQDTRNIQDDPGQRLLQDIERALNTGIPGLEAAVSTIRRYGAVISGGS